MPVHPSSWRRATFFAVRRVGLVLLCEVVEWFEGADEGSSGGLGLFELLGEGRNFEVVELAEGLVCEVGRWFGHGSVSSSGLRRQ